MSIERVVEGLHLIAGVLQWAIRLGDQRLLHLGRRFFAIILVYVSSRAVGPNLLGD